MLMPMGHRLLTMMPILRSQARSRGEPRDLEPSTEHELSSYSQVHTSGVLLSLPLRLDASLTPPSTSTEVDTDRQVLPWPCCKKRKEKKKLKSGKE